MLKAPVRSNEMRVEAPKVQLKKKKKKKKGYWLAAGGSSCLITSLSFW